MTWLHVAIGLTGLGFVLSLRSTAAGVVCAFLALGAGLWGIV